MVSISHRFPLDQEVTREDLEAWLEDLEGHYSQKDVDRLRQAVDWAMEIVARRPPLKAQGELVHALAVAEILSGMRLDIDTLMAAILQGLNVRTESDSGPLLKGLGTTLAGMLDDLGRIGALVSDSRLDLESQDEDQSEKIRRLLLGLARDVRVILVVLADQLHRLRTAKALPAETKLGLARLALHLYAPLANRLGVGQIKWELEDLALRYLVPEEYREIAGLLDGKRKDRETFIREVIGLLQIQLDSQGIRGEISGRPKHIYSIWKKMQRKAVAFDQIFDVLAFRVLVESIADCYAVLGIVNSLWEPIAGEFDDYIARPKGNMYQSLHAAVVGPGGRPLEIQIRTWDMHKYAELGIAAHWRYKENAGHDADFDRRVQWMRQWLEPGSGGGEGLGEAERAALTPAVVYVLTPKGKVIELPKGSTPLDFAYEIHTEIGHRCRGARVNGRIVQLTYQLESGQQVEILTAKEAAPSRDWLNPHNHYLCTDKARNRIRQWFKHQDYDQHLALGRANLERELNRLGIIEKVDLGEVAARYNFKKGEDLLAAVGRNELSVIQVAGALSVRYPPPPKKEPAPHPKRPSPHPPRIGGEVRVAGVEDVMTHMAGCCKPVPQDVIVGFITQGRGVTIHRRDCPNVVRIDESGRRRLVDVEWSDQAVGSSYPVDVFVLATDRKGLLRDVSAIFTEADIDVTGVHTQSDRRSDTARMQFTIEVVDVERLNRVLNKVAQLPEVLEVRRLV